MFPMTMTIHTPAQLNAVLSALRPELQASDFAHPAVGAAYEEASAKVRANDAALQAGQQVKEAAAPAGKPTPAATEAATGARGQRTAAAAAATDAPEKTADGPTPTAASAAAEPQASTAAEPIPYERVGKAITEMAKNNRAKAVATLDAFGVKKGPELKPEQYADFLAALEA